MAENLELIFW